MFTIYGGKTEFNQWEQGHRVTNPKLAVGDKVRFWNASGETHPMIAYMHEGVVVADVPNDLLQHYSPILVELCGDPECLTRFIVNAQDKPADYVFIDNTHCESAHSGQGGGGVSSWNDLTDKPFYKEETVLWSAENAQAGRLGRPMTIQDENGTNIFFGLKVGGNYQVEYDGKVYPCTAFSWATGDITGVAIGNSALMPSGYTSDEPNNSMSILFLDSEGSTAYCIEDTDEHSVKVSDVSIHRIDPEYLPEGYPYKTEETILDGTFEFADTGNGFYLSPIAYEVFALVDGKTYTVIWDGEGYRCVATFTNGITALGNLGLFGQTNTGEPFLFSVNKDAGMVGIVAQDTAATHTVKVCTEKVQPMSKEYLPEGVGGGAFIVNVTMDENDNYVADKTYAEISEALVSGQMPYCVYGNAVFHLMFSKALQATYAMSMGLIFVNISGDLDVTMIGMYEDDTVRIDERGTLSITTT